MADEEKEIKLTPKQEAFCREYLNNLHVHLASVLSGCPLLISSGDSYFVYFLCDPIDHTIFYIGKGKGKRPYHHINESFKSKGFNVKKNQAIRNIHSAGREVEIFYIATNVSEKTAYAIERALIKRIGRANLTNISSGYNFQTDADRAKYQLGRIKKLSVFCAENRKPGDIELYLMIVSGFMKIAA